MDAVQFILPPRFGRHVRRVTEDESAQKKAADWLAGWKAGQITHENVEINACTIQFDGYTPTGLKTFDEQRARSSGFSTGNVTSNVQTSALIASRYWVNNGGVHNFPEGEAQGNQLKWIRDSRVPHANDVISLVLSAPDDASDPTSVACVYLLHHYHGPRDDRKRIDHGWIVTDRNGDLLGRFDISNNAISQKILDQAQYVFTGMHSDPKTLLKLVDNQITFVDPEVQGLAEEIEAQQAQRPRVRS